MKTLLVLATAGIAFVFFAYGAAMVHRALWGYKDSQDWVYFMAAAIGFVLSASFAAVSLLTRRTASRHH